MKTAKTTIKLFPTVIVLVAVAVIWSAWGAKQARAISNSEMTLSPIGITFGQTARRVDALAEDHNQFVVGLSSGQTARLSALNSGEEIGIIIDFKIFDSQGRVLAESPERQMKEQRKQK